ncbi:Transposon Ty3-I Gag-Pol polyprotein [Thelohanellus kitauei]|uniref:Transposon Ty3-I Gag-Pol polyprotein n=1 Tax=Thelohanellus kitauei TaxID=669202 RepID=A0A0C2N2H2_THEKT|nr:Transposon Ty3-I Gag-Pol polyprotein [Thelohanellus kitauei]
MDKNDIEKTAFSLGHEYGLFEFTVMPFGLTGAPGTFQSIMNEIFRNVQFVVVYLDDILVYSPDYQVNEEHLETVCKLLTHNGFTVKMAKPQIAVSKVSYLGHVFSAEGMTTDEEKVKAVKNWPTPANKKELQKFIGLASYYRKFIENFAEISRPLHVLCQDKSQFIWEEEHEYAMKRLKEQLSSSIFLAYPNPNKTFSVYTDASNLAISAVLEQENRVIAYSAYELECLAIINALKKFRHYLIGSKFLLYCDHEPLKWLLNNKIRDGRIGRWIVQTQEFNFEIHYRKGKENGNADALSRIVCYTELEHMISLQELQNEQMKDNQIRKIVEFVKSDRWPSKVSMDALTKRYYQISQQLKIIDNVLHREMRTLNKNEGKRAVPVIPASLISKVLMFYHDNVRAGHFSYQKTIERILEMAYWPGMHAETLHYCQTCMTCELVNLKTVKTELEPLQTSLPWEVVGVDVLELPISKNGYRLFYKWVHVARLKNQSSETIVDELNKLFLLFGPPKAIHSDQGRSFESHLFKKLCEGWNLNKSRTSAYHPQCNGLVERANRTLLNLLRKNVAPHEDWEELIDSLVYAYNTSTHSSTKVPPFMALMGREPNNLIIERKKEMQELVSHMRGKHINLAR